MDYTFKVVLNPQGGGQRQVYLRDAQAQSRIDDLDGRIGEIDGEITARVQPSGGTFYRYGVPTTDNWCEKYESDGDVGVVVETAGATRKFNLRDNAPSGIYISSGNTDTGNRQVWNISAKGVNAQLKGYKIVARVRGDEGSILLTTEDGTVYSILPNASTTIEVSGDIGVGTSFTTEDASAVPNDRQLWVERFEIYVEGNSRFATKGYVDGLDAATNARIDGLGTVYKVRGSSAWTVDSPTSALMNSEPGDVWNITEDFTLNGKSYPAGTNVVCIAPSMSSPDYNDRFDALAGSIDLSGYYTRAEAQTLEGQVVKHTAQDLTDAQKTQARSNIGAASEAAIKELQETLLLGNDFMAAAWADGQSSPVPVEERGNKTSIDYVPLLIDHTRNDNDGTVEVGILRHNNFLRFKNGNFAPVVCITEAQYNECMNHVLYIEGDSEAYCAQGEFDPVSFYNAYKSVTEVNGVKVLTLPKLLKDTADGDEVEHYLLPWETTSRDYSVMMGHKDTLYFLQNAKGKSGKIWNVLSTTPKTWDGKVATELKPTAISITTPTNVTIDGTRRTRCHFGAFDGSAAAADGYTAGRAGYVSNMFANTGRLMGECALAWNGTNGYVVHSRADNADPTDGMPFAEGGWHEFNAFVSWLELKYGTRDLTTIFKSGISANDSCSNEAQFLSNGGVRCRIAGSSDPWEYRTLGGNSAICMRNNNGTPAATNWSDMLNLTAPKEACMEAQIAASYAVELGIAEGEEYECYGKTYRWAALDGADSLTDGRMNCLIYSKREGVATGLNPQGESETFDVEVMLRMSLYEGASLAGDVYNQRNGGFEAVGTHISPNNASGQVGEHVDFYSQPNQEQWIKNDTVSTGGPGVKFACEKAYEKTGEHTTIANGYSVKDYEGTPFKSTGGAGLHTYMSHYVYEYNYWNYSAYGVRARIGLRFRGVATNSYCAPRYLDAIISVAVASSFCCGSAQVRLKSAAPSQTE